MRTRQNRRARRTGMCAAGDGGSDSGKWWATSEAIRRIARMARREYGVRTESVVPGNNQGNQCQQQHGRHHGRHQGCSSAVREYAAITTHVERVCRAVAPPIGADVEHNRTLPLCRDGTDGHDQRLWKGDHAADGRRGNDQPDGDQAEPGRQAPRITGNHGFGRADRECEPPRALRAIMAHDARGRVAAPLPPEKLSHRLADSHSRLPSLRPPYSARPIPARIIIKAIA